MRDANDIISEISEVLVSLTKNYEERTTLNLRRHDEERKVESVKSLAVLQGIGTLKEHGSNAEARKRYLQTWLSEQPEYVSATREIVGIERALIPVQDAIALGQGRLHGLGDIAKLVAGMNTAVQTVTGM